ncbi:hypothetical protein YPPY53_3433, partial [Yersinia pestis PY-53]
MAWQGLQ